MFLGEDLQSKKVLRAGDKAGVLLRAQAPMTETAPVNCRGAGSTGGACVCTRVCVPANHFCLHWAKRIHLS